MAKHGTTEPNSIKGTTPENPGNLLELKNPPGNLLEFNGPPGNFCVRCSTALVSGHKSGYQIAYS